MQVDRLNEEIKRTWRKLEQQPGGLHCIDMLVRPSLCLLETFVDWASINASMPRKESRCPSQDGICFISDADTLPARALPLHNGTDKDDINNRTFS